MKTNNNDKNWFINHESMKEQHAHKKWKFYQSTLKKDIKVKLMIEIMKKLNS